MALFVMLKLLEETDPNPKFVLAPAALVAPVPPLLIAIVPVTLEANPTVPVILAAVRLVSPDPLPLVRRSSSGKFVRLIASPFVAKVPMAVLAASALVAVNRLLPTVVAPKFTRAFEALVAPVPPLLIAIIPVTLDASPTVPVMLAAVRFVRPPPLPLVVSKLAGKLTRLVALPLVAKAPTTPAKGMLVKLTPLLEAKFERTVEEG